MRSIKRQFSIIFRADFKKALRMIADGANLRRGGAYDDMTAVAAFPNFNLTAGKNLSRFDVFQKGAVTLLMMLLYSRHHAETAGKLGEALLLGGLGKALVHIGPLVIFPVSRGG